VNSSNISTVLDRHFKCPAKINLFLRVLGQSGGYHQLESALVTINLFDDLLVEEYSKTEIIIKGPYSEKVDPKDNLFTTILDFFHKNYSISKNIKVTITKNIPVLAGLGGGSSNAAYFMIALNEIFNLSLTTEKLQELSFNFGSDIAFFIATKNAALIKGRGEVDKILNLEKPKILLVNPNKPLSTKDVFKNHNLTTPTNTPPVIERSKATWQSRTFLELSQIENDLETTAITLLPEIKTILIELKEHNATSAKMSGSGPSCFAIFKNEEDLNTCYNHFKTNHPTYFTKVC